MSREGWRDFLLAAERSPALQRELRACREPKQILECGQRLGFSLSMKDLHQDVQAEAIIDWFNQSKIH